ncbi:hypothetical protein [Tuwongella immobilis]|uniref:Uncharacterized protein n=1 Tax=Tuwongella immobilis TaxID=692036 RepID=A0A6C2YU15_9BACT|nr:hypothetical protein [Tuwongella immobilis]VIP05238.1 unnamed protein product [Tuwongella immobilis]VTS07832.1 unnamed protein product [Tuwongella immobilis]
MTAFRLLLNPDERLDVKYAVQLLKEVFPSTVVEGDTFERKRRQLAENLATLSGQGEPIRNPDMFLQVIARSEAETGPGVDVSFTVDNMKLKGAILSGGISLSSSNQLSPEIIQQVEGLLQSFQIGRVNVITE